MAWQVVGSNGSTHLRWTRMAHSTLDGLAEDCPFNLSMAYSFVGNKLEIPMRNLVMSIFLYSAGHTVK